MPAGGGRDRFVEKGISSIFENFDVKKTESGAWMMRRRRRSD
jgi:hypothetical protein